MSKQTLTPWWKGFLTSILGTTISIALTFGTTTLVNSKKKQDAQRLTAMMVIDDIDKSIETLKKIRDDEEQGYNAAMYVIEHLDSIESLPDDTLEIVFNYLLEGARLNTEFEFNKSTEKMFHSTQDSWSNLNSVKFVRNIEDFYKDRKKVDELKYSYTKKPVPAAETDTVTMDSDILDSKKDFCGYLKEVLKRRRCQKYLQFYINRLRLYNQIIADWTNLNDENKFLMNITDEELKEFVEESTKRNLPASEKDIIGTWINDAVDAHVTVFEFKQDYTLRYLESYSLHKKNLVRNSSGIRIYPIFPAIFPVTFPAVMATFTLKLSSPVKNTLNQHFTTYYSQQNKSNPWNKLLKPQKHIRGIMYKKKAYNRHQKLKSSVSSRHFNAPFFLHMAVCKAVCKGH